MLWLCFLLAACAQVRSISGGEKDLKAPELKETIPPSGSLNFNSKTIILNFDEYVQLNNLSQELIVSPPLAHAPDVKIKHKSVVVQLNDELIPNTTYMFNFGDGITDVNENNKAADLIYVFSTGSFIDSLELKGNIHNAYEDSPFSGLKVMLFENDTDVFSKKKLPIYFTKTKEDGSFTLPYLREGDFFVYAIDDANSNYKWDEGEALAKSDSAIHVSDGDSTLMKLFASVPLPKKPAITNYDADSTGTLYFTLDKHFQPIDFVSLSGLETSICTNGDSIVVHFIGPPSNRIEQLHILKKDLISDTVDVPFFSSPFEKEFNVLVKSAKKIRMQDSLMIQSSQLTEVFDKTAILLMQDSTPIPIELLPSQNSCNYVCNAKLSPGKNYSMQLMPGALKNRLGSTNDTLDFSFSTFRKEELGELQFEISGLDSSLEYHFVLLEKSGLEFFRKSQVKNELLQIANLPAGEYAAKILEDKNHNELFDPASIQPYTPSELMYVFPNKISVRANWEMKLKWELK